MIYERAEEPTEIIDVSWPCTFVQATEIKKAYEEKGYAVELKHSDDGSKQVWFFVYERVLIK